MKIKETEMDIAIQGRSTMRLSHSIRLIEFFPARIIFMLNYSFIYFIM